MKLSKSKNVQMVLSALGMVVAVVLFYGLPSVLAPVISPILSQVLVAQSVQPTEAKWVYNTRVAIVGLPPGQRFMYIIPKEQATEVVMAKPDRNIYVTYQNQETGSLVLNMASPRLIRFLQPGNTPGSWDEILYIQER